MRVPGNFHRVFVFDPDLSAAVGPRVRKSPVFDCTVRAGLSAVSTYNHMWLPMSYGDLDAEYERLTTRVSMWDVCAQRHVSVEGADADRLTQLVTAVDVSDTPPGQAIYAPMVDGDGTLINDPVLLHWLDRTWRFSIADADVGLWLAGVAHGREFDITVRELDTVTIAIQGPNAHDVTAALGLEWTAGLDRFRLRRATIAAPDRGRIDVVVSRSGWSSQDGVEIFCDQADVAESLWQAIAAAGEPFGIGPGAPNATERIENTFLSYGTDTGYDANPLELGMADTIDLDGPDFIGRDALRRISADGPGRQLIGCVIAGDDIDTLPHPVPLSIDSTDVGRLRAGTHSPRFRRNIGLALIDARCSPGDIGIVVLPAGHGERSVRLVDLPFDRSLSG